MHAIQQKGAFAPRPTASAIGGMVMAKRGFTLIELLVVIAIIAILAAILFPVFAKAREKARQTTCLSNEKELATAVLMYAEDWGETFPAHRSAATNNVSWRTMIFPYQKSEDIYVCPSNPDNSKWTHDGGDSQGNPDPNDAPPNFRRSYGLSRAVVRRAGVGRRLSELRLPAQTALIGEVWNTSNNGINLRWGSHWSKNRIANRIFAGHNCGMNIAFCDGHAKWMKPTATTDPNIWDREPDVHPVSHPTVVAGMKLVEEKWR